MSVVLLVVIGRTLTGHLPQGLFVSIVVLIISCSCALGVVTPTVLMVGVGRDADAGVLTRGGEILERAEKLTIVVSDKMGTITRGEPTVTDILPLGTHQEAELLSTAAAVEPGSGYPPSEAIVRVTQHHKLATRKANNIQVLSGMGIQGVTDDQQT